MGRRRRSSICARPVSGLALRLTALALAAAAAFGLWMFTQVYLAGKQDDRAPADVIIVMGAAQYAGRPSPVYQGRLEHALQLWRAGAARRILFTGGGAPGDICTEARAGRAWALRRGVPPACILTEERGRTTLQSLRAAHGIMRARGLTTAILVSDSFHAFRLRRMARDLGMQAGVSPTPTSRVKSREMKARFMLREVWVYSIYRVAGI